MPRWGGLACLLAAAWPPLSQAMRRPADQPEIVPFFFTERQSTTSPSPPPRCPASARRSAPSFTRNCECQTDIGKRCFVATPSGQWRRGCESWSGTRGTRYFSMRCTNCECFSVPEISANGSAVQVDGAASVVVMRQGKVVVNEARRHRRRWEYNFGDHLHKEFLVIGKTRDNFRAEKLVFAQHSELCGVGLFTTSQLVCSQLGARDTKRGSEDIMAWLRATAAPTEMERGFGLEYEFVGRTIPEDVRSALSVTVNRTQMSETVLDSIVDLMEALGGHSSREEVETLLRPYNDVMTAIDQMSSSDLTILEQCFANTTQPHGAAGSRRCSQHADCALSEYCMDCDGPRPRSVGRRVWDQVTSWAPGQGEGRPPLVLYEGCASRSSKVCRPRSGCAEGFSVGGGTCPTALEKWSWTSDSTVSPLRPDQAAALGVGRGEQEGAGFELVSPPLSSLEGVRSAAEVLSVLRRMGIQAGSSSGLHVHVNVASSKVPGTPLSPRQIANLWVAFVRFQLVIDEFLSPSRPGNHFNRRLFLRTYGDHVQPDDCEWNDGYNNCARRFFKQIHGYVNHAGALPPGTDNVTSFCNMALALPNSPNPCRVRYPDQRYYALNLVPLVRLGTVEFRAHSATYDAERVLRWAQFAVAFVEHFGAGAPGDAAPFLDVPVEQGLKALARAQRAATAEELFSSMEGKISPRSRAFYAARDWERRAPGCDDRPGGGTGRFGPGSIFFDPLGGR